ncbi:MAG: hypothetical protein IPL79_08850 [Myxococcales bacterium]|nr:hypothetical protein [Myxococcales bacterium]
MARLSPLTALPVAVSLSLATACMTTVPASEEQEGASDKAYTTYVWEFDDLAEQRIAGESTEQAVARYCATDHHPRIVQATIFNMTPGAAEYELGPGDAISLFMVGCWDGQQSYAGTFYGTYRVEGETLWLTGNLSASETDMWGTRTSAQESNAAFQLDYVAFDDLLEDVYFDMKPPAAHYATSALVSTLFPATLVVRSAP